MSVMLLTEHHFEFPSLKGDCTGSSESELTIKALLYATFSCSFVTYKVFWVRCDTNCIDSLHLRSSLLFFLLTRVPTHKKYRILCYPLRSNSGWLPIRCAYFILFCLQASYIPLVHSRQGSSAEDINAMDSLRSILDNAGFPDSECFCFGFKYLNNETNRVSNIC